MNRQNLIEGYSKSAMIFFLVFYAVAIVGFNFPETRPLFLNLTPLALLLSFTGMMIYHEGNFDRKTIGTFLLIFVLGYFAEVAGVLSGRIFGTYHYDTALGWKFLETPLLIGMNWLMLTYGFATIVRKSKLSHIAKLVVAASGMVLYDAVLEPSASALQMWTWENGQIPPQNYTAWFAFSLLFQWIIQGSGIQLKNRIAWLILLCQFVFFLVLYVTQFFNL